MAKRDTTFEMKVLGADPAIQRFRAIKSLLVRRGYGRGLHAKDCICLTCIEGALRKIIKKK